MSPPPSDRSETENHAAPDDGTPSAQDRAELDAIAEAWQDTVTAPDRVQQQSRDSLRRIAGVSAPSSVVRSAEGVTQFDGLYHKGNGELSSITRSALKRSAVFRRKVDRSNEGPPTGVPADS